jgi:hypothetical protein
LTVPISAPAQALTNDRERYPIAAAGRLVLQGFFE